MKDLVINGWDIIKECKLPAWPEVWKTLKKTLARVMSDIKWRNNKKQILGFLKIQMKHMKR
jgi:hypothetical protein